MRPAETLVGQSVRSLQTMLRILSKDDPSLPSVIPDGIYGTQTRNAVSAFQRKYGIPVTGVTNRQTWDRIVAEHASAVIRIGPAQPLQLILDPGQVIGSGQQEPTIYLVQSMLTVLAQTYGSITAPPITGTLDRPTADALSTFQYLSALPQTGALDKITWKHLALQYPLATNIGKKSRKAT